MGQPRVPIMEVTGKSRPRFPHALVGVIFAWILNYYMGQLLSRQCRFTVSAGCLFTLLSVTWIALGDIGAPDMLYGRVTLGGTPANGDSMEV